MVWTTIDSQPPSSPNLQRHSAPLISQNKTCNKSPVSSAWHPFTWKSGTPVPRISRDTYIRCCRRDIHIQIPARSSSPERPICVDHPNYDVQQDPSNIPFISCSSFPCEDVEGLAAEESVCTFAGVDGGVEACEISSHLPAQNVLLLPNTVNEMYLVFRCATKIQQSACNMCNVGSFRITSTALHLRRVILEIVNSATCSITV